MNKEKLLEEVNKVLKLEGQENIKLSNEEKLNVYILPSLEQAKNTLSNLYKFEPRKGSGFLGKLKFLILTKLKNIVINVVERESMRQQKFNELTFQAIDVLIKENKELRDQIEKR